MLLLAFLTCTFCEKVKPVDALSHLHTQLVPLVSLSDPVNSICGLRLIHTRQRRIIGGENSLR